MKVCPGVVKRLLRLGRNSGFGFANSASCAILKGTQAEDDAAWDILDGERDHNRAIAALAQMTLEGQVE